MSSPAAKMTVTQWTVCIIAAIGFAFDIYELLMLPLIIKPALSSLGGLVPGTPEYREWARTLFFVPAVIGGIFGLWGGYLTDRLGRRRVLTWSILLYAFSAAAAGLVTTTLWQLLFFRCLVFIGVCVEFVAAVAWLAELFDDHDQREKVLGYTQAFSSVGGLLVGVANVASAGLATWLINAYGDTLPSWVPTEAWRFTLISGVIPALPLIFIRPFLPESPKWQQKRLAGQLRRPSIMELFSPQLVRTTLVTTICFAASYGMAFGAIQQLPQILAGHQEVKALVAEVQKTAKVDKPDINEQQLKRVAGNASDEAVARVTIWQEIGGLFGRFVFAVLAARVISRRGLLRTFQIPALIFVPLLFWWISRSLQAESLMLIKMGVFVAGALVVSQFSFWGNYIPRVFPLHLRGTGESFAANIGGRIIGTAAAWITLTFADATPPDPAKMAYVGAIVAGLYCLVGVIMTTILPEPPRHDLAD